MRILLILLTICFLACKNKTKINLDSKLAKSTGSTKIVDSDTSQLGNTNLSDSIILFGDKLISNKSFINELDKITILNIGDNSYPTNELKFDYTNPNFKKTITINSIELEIGISKPKYIKHIDGYKTIFNNEKILKIYKNKILIDSILLYGEETTDYSSVIKYSYLNKNFDLWILEILLPLEEESAINYWKKYKIDTSSGKILLVEELIAQRYGNENNFEIDSTVYAQVETYLNVRSAPNPSGTIIVKAHPKDPLKVLEILDGWLKISFNGTEGYVSSDFVK